MKMAPLPSALLGSIPDRLLRGKREIDRVGESRMTEAPSALLLISVSCALLMCIIGLSFVSKAPVFLLLLAGVSACWIGIGDRVARSRLQVFVTNGHQQRLAQVSSQLAAGSLHEKVVDVPTTSSRIAQPEAPLASESLASKTADASTLVGSRRPKETDKALLLQACDDLEDLIDEALNIVLGSLAKDATLRDTVNHLEEIGFITADDRAIWGRCLAVRNILLLSSGLDYSVSFVTDLDTAVANVLSLRTTLTSGVRSLQRQDRDLQEQEHRAEKEAQRLAGMQRSAEED